VIKRFSRSQIIILEKSKYILVKHWAKKENRYFWGIPGGGREEGESDEEAAIREAKEETGLDIKLLPIKMVAKPPFKNSMYDRMVTFLAYPVKGEAKIGYDPEEELTKYYELVELKWQDFYSDEGVPEATTSLIKYFRDIIKSDKVVKVK
jgi:8-oxo-dGTP diphosphatase